MTTPREHVTSKDFLCQSCEGCGSDWFGRCHSCKGTGMDLELLADLYNGLSAAVREAQARTEGDDG